jgi:GNAT superfamily N-acetyltransferase
MIREWELREAQVDHRVADFLKAFEGATSFVKVDSDYTFNRYKALMEAGICRIFIAEEKEILQGAIGFLLVDDLHDGTKTAIEMFWFAHPDFRGVGKMLFNTFEVEAIKAGCKKLAMIHLADSYPESLEQFYIKNGYKLLEKHYVKEV